MVKPIQILGRGGSAARMKYKGYAAKIEFDDQANVFNGEVLNLRDVIAFQGRTVRDLSTNHSPR